MTKGTRIKHGCPFYVIGKNYSKSTLNSMTKKELIKVLDVAQHNYEALLDRYGNVQAYIEELKKESMQRDVVLNVKVVKKEEYMPCSYYCPTCNKQQKDSLKNRREGCYCERCGQKLSPFINSQND